MVVTRRTLMAQTLQLVQLQLNHRGQMNPRIFAYSKPVPKMPVITSFCLWENCKDHMTGSGRATMAKSVAILINATLRS